MTSMQLRRDDVIVGVDTHKEQHVAVLLDGLGGKLDELFLPATNAGYGELLTFCQQHVGPAGRLLTFGVEGTGSYGVGLAQFLRRSGCKVREVHRPPRKGERRLSGKSDTIDAEHAARQVLAGLSTAVPKTADGSIESLRLLKIARDTAVKARSTAMITLKATLVTADDELRATLYARTDGHRLRRVEPLAQATRELAALVRARTSLVEARTAASNQLWAILAEHWPGAALVFQKLTSQIALAFLADYPTPRSAARLGEGRMHQFCRRHSYRGGKSPAELVSRLRAAPASADPIAEKVLEAIVRSSLAQIGLLNAEITGLERQLADALATHPKTALLKTLPRVATVSLASLIAEIGPLLERCENPEQVAAMCGAAPVTKASGKSRNVGFRYTANKPARVAITSFADNSRHCSAWASDSYRRARARGARHPHAVRILARGWVRVIWACWTTDTPYDPSRHRGEQRLLAA